MTGKNKGFTLVEMLAVVSIVVILLAVSAVGVAYYMRWLQITELDNAAREIYMAAENRALLLHNEGRLKGLVVQEDSDYNAITVPSVDSEGSIKDEVFYYVEYRPGYQALESLLPANSIEHSLFEGYFYLVYEPDGGNITDVFFSRRDMSVEDFQAFYVMWRGTPKNRRMKNNPMIGYYGSQTAANGNIGALFTPVIEIINREKLILNVSYRVPNSLADETSLQVELAYGDCSIPLELEGTPAFSGNYRVYSYSWVLDSLEEENHFYNLFDQVSNPPGEFGGDFTVTATVSHTGSSASTAVAENNSLFAKDSGGETAYVEYLRHLQNLDREISKTAGKKNAVQRANINAALYESAPYEFVPIVHDELAYYDGDGFVIRNVTITGQSGSTKTASGLFADVKGMKFSDVRLVNTAVQRTDGKPVGALTGRAEGVSFDGCRIYWEPMVGSFNLRGLLGDSSRGYRYQLKGNAQAGGLAGILSGDNNEIRECLSATLIEGETVGGLIGENEGTVAVEHSYADCYLSGTGAVSGPEGIIEGDVKGNAAGLVGWSKGSVSIRDCYAAGFIDMGRTKAGAGLCLGEGSCLAGHTYSAMRYPGIENRDPNTDIVPLCPNMTEEGGENSVFYLRFRGMLSEEDGDIHAKDYYAMTTVSDTDDDFAAVMGQDHFQWKSYGESHPYNLRTDLDLDAYSFPGLKGIPHYGDWGVQFHNFSLVYYEQYTGEGGYGFEGGNVSFLKEDSTVVQDGYAVVISKEDMDTLGDSLNITFVYDGEESGTQKNGEYVFAVSEMPQVTDGDTTYYLACLPGEIVNQPYTDGDFYQYMSFSYMLSGEAMKGEYYYCPHFARSVLPYDEALEMKTAAEGLAVSVRSPRHLYMLSQYSDYYHNGHDYRFYQELNLDYGLYTGYGLFTNGFVQEPAGSFSLPFTGTYDGGCHTIRNVVFDTRGGRQRLYAGLFGYSGGTIRNVAYLLDAERTFSVSMGNSADNLYVGGLVGGNSGTIENCAVAGLNLIGQAFGSTIYVGGLAGQNQGLIRNSAAESASLSADNSSYGTAYVGGLVGENTDSGMISTCYATGRVTAEVDSTSQARVCGFAGYNRGNIEDSYGAVDLESSGFNVETYGFCGVTQGNQRGTYYLNTGNFTYRDISYSAHYAPRKAAQATYQELTEGDSLVAGMGKGAAVLEWDGGTYPYPAVVVNSQGEYVHYGQFPVPMKLGVMGVYYWERLEIDGMGSYHVSLLAADSNDRSITKNSTLSTAHSDGGVVTDYGYGYYGEEGSRINVSANDICYSENGGVGGLFDAGYPSDGIVDQALKDLMPGYDFHSYHSYGMENDGGGLYPRGEYEDPDHVIYQNPYGYKDSNGRLVNIMNYKRKPNGTLTLKQGGTSVTFAINPHFADAMSVTSPGGWELDSDMLAIPPGMSEENPYGIRALYQLQCMNWHLVTSGDSSGGSPIEFSVNRTVYNATNGFYGGNQYGFLYLSHDVRHSAVTEGNYNHSWTELYDYYWVQSHDLDGKKNDGSDTQFTPIAAFEDRKNSNADNEQNGGAAGKDVTILTAWFGGSYDGNEYTIKNINIKADGANCVGLFGVTLDATLKDIILYSESGENTVTVTGNTSCHLYHSWYAAGGLVGLAGVSAENTDASKTISNCSVAGYTIIDNTRDINSNSYGGGAVGGLVGVCNLSLEGCTAVTTIDLEAVHNNIPDSFGTDLPLRAGGLAGACVAGINNCYVGGKIKVSENNGIRSNRYIGGIVGGAGMRPMFVPYYSVTPTGGEVSVRNSYSYMELPDKNSGGKIQNLYAIGGAGGSASFYVTLSNDYYLGMELESDDRFSVIVENVPPTGGWRVNTNYSWGSGMVSRTIRVNGTNYYYTNQQNGSSGTSGGEITGSALFEQSRSQWNRYTFKGWLIIDNGQYRLSTNWNEVQNAYSKTIPNDIHALTYPQLAGRDDIPINGELKNIYTLLPAFSPVTSQNDEGYSMAGRYSYAPANEPNLAGLNYPFPTILTRGRKSIHVHYGSWPQNGIVRPDGGRSIELDLFTRSSWTERLTLSEDVAFGGTWEVTSADPAIATGFGDASQAGPGQEAGFNLTVTGNGVGTTVLTVSYRLGSSVHTLDITVNVTARLELRPGEGMVEMFTNDAVEVQLLPYGRSWNSGETQPVLDLTAQNIAVTFQADSINHDEHKTVSVEQRDGGIFMKLASDSTDGVSSISLGYGYGLSGAAYGGISAVPIRATAPGILPAQPVVKVNESGNVAVTFAKSGGETAVIDAISSAESGNPDIAVVAMAVADNNGADGKISLTVTGVAAGEANIVLKVSLTMDGRRHDVEVAVPITIEGQ